MALQQSSKELNLKIDIFDEVGIGGGASGISGGLLHPYSPKGTTFIIFHLQLLSMDVMFYFLLIVWNIVNDLVKPLWEGAQCWKESIKLLRIAEEASLSKDYTIEDMKAFVVNKRYFRLFSTVSSLKMFSFLV